MKKTFRYLFVLILLLAQNQLHADIQFDTDVSSEISNGSTMGDILVKSHKVFTVFLCAIFLFSVWGKISVLISKDEEREQGENWKIGKNIVFKLFLLFLGVFGSDWLINHI